MVENKSMHGLGQMIASRDATIKRLQKELAEARAGGQPASQLRDAVLPVCEAIYEQMALPNEGKARSMLHGLIAHLKTIPTLEPPSDKRVDKGGGPKPWKPLDHGKPER